MVLVLFIFYVEIGEEEMDGLVDNDDDDVWDDGFEGLIEMEWVFERCVMGWCG